MKKDDDKFYTWKYWKLNNEMTISTAQQEGPSDWLLFTMSAVFYSITELEIYYYYYYALELFSWKLTISQSIFLQFRLLFINEV